MSLFRNLSLTFVALAAGFVIGCTQPAPAPTPTTPPPPPAATTPAPPASGAPASPGTTLASPSGTAASPAASPSGAVASPGADGKSGDEKGGKADGATSYTHKAAGITFDVPKGWKTAMEGDVLQMDSPGEDVCVVFIVPEKDFDTVAKEVDKEISKLMKDIKAEGEPETKELNGMKWVTQSGSGKVEGQAVEWSVDFLAAKKPVLILSFGNKGKMEPHMDAYASFIKSIKKT